MTAFGIYVHDAIRSLQRCCSYGASSFVPGTLSKVKRLALTDNVLRWFPIQHHGLRSAWVANRITSDQSQPWKVAVHKRIPCKLIEPNVAALDRIARPLATGAALNEPRNIAAGASNGHGTAANYTRRHRLAPNSTRRCNESASSVRA